MYAGVFNLQLKKELDASDLAFLEEIKDLKYTTIRKLSRKRTVDSTS